MPECVCMVLGDKDYRKWYLSALRHKRMMPESIIILVRERARIDWIARFEDMWQSA